MKRFFCLTGVFILACFAQGCASESHDQMIDATKQLDARFVDSFSKGDVEGVMSTYWNSPDLVVFPPGEMQARGWDNVKASMDRAIKGMPGAKLQEMDVTYLPVGDAVVSWGLWKISFPNAHPAIPSIDGRYTEVAMKKNGKWLLIHDHPSAPMAEPK